MKRTINLHKNYFMKLFAALLVSLFFFQATAQVADQPNDFLSKAFYKGRRQKLRERLRANSVAVFFGNPVRNRANDVDYVYHQDPDFFYLTGYKEPNALLMVFKDSQVSANGTSYDEIIFVQPRNEEREMWNGRRLGDVGTKENLGLDQAFNNTEFKRYNIDFTKFASILFFDLQHD